MEKCCGDGEVLENIVVEKCWRRVWGEVLYRSVLARCCREVL